MENISGLPKSQVGGFIRHNCSFIIMVILKLTSHLVTIPGEDPYTANSSAVIPYVYLNNFQPGDNCSVLVDPKNPQHVKITNT